MEKLTPSQTEFLIKYQELLEGMGEAFQYLSSVSNLESDISHTVFSDLVKAGQQLHLCHGQLVTLINLRDLSSFDAFIEKMSKWFEADEDKATLLTDSLIPSFEAWKETINEKMRPYVLQ